MTRYSTPVFRRLAEESIANHSRIDRLRQIERAEQLATSLELTGRYATGDLSRHVSQNDSVSDDGVLTGQDAYNDLRRFIDDVSAKTAINA